MTRLRPLLLALPLLAACQPKASLDTPAAAFETFNQAMKSGDAEAAADVVDFDLIAAAANPDWDSIPPGQRGQITDKMREDTVKGLTSTGYPSEGMTAAAGAPAGDTATVTATGGGQSLTLRLKQTDGGWKIVDGVPGMTTSSGMSGG